MKRPDGMKALIQQVVQDVLGAEMDETVGAQKSERSEARAGYRSGYYTRTLVTRVGKLVLRVPQDRQGRFRTEVFEWYQRRQVHEHFRPHLKRMSKRPADSRIPS